MKLIKISKTEFVDAEKIESISFLADGAIMVFLQSREDEYYLVQKEHANVFLNHLQAFNAGFDNVQTAWIKMFQKDKS